MLKKKSESIIENINHIELSIKECGREKCSPIKHIFSYAKKWHVLHYIMAGKGTFVLNGKTYRLKRGHMFYIPPGFEAEYYPDPKDPWEYSWVGFSGLSANDYLKASGLSLNYPIFYDEEMVLGEHFLRLVEAYNHFGVLNIRSLGYLYVILSYMIEICSQKQNIAISIQESHVMQAIEFISYNYQFDISVKDIANSLNLTPNYLANLFKSQLGMSTKQFLTRYRMEKACELLEDESMPIKEVAKQVGYDNQLHFSNEFKKIMKLSPTTYRKKLKGEVVNG